MSYKRIALLAPQGHTGSAAEMLAARGFVAPIPRFTVGCEAEVVAAVQRISIECVAGIR